jgi:hypothetical protein
VGEAVQRTINVTVAVAVGAPAFVPVIVKVNVPRVRPELTVSVDVVPVTLEGLKLAVAPEARPLTDRATAPENPADRATVTAYVVLDRREIVRDAGVADSVNDAGAATTNVTVVVCVTVPLTPVIVTG